MLDLYDVQIIWNCAHRYTTNQCTITLGIQANVAGVNVIERYRLWRWHSGAKLHGL